MVNWIRQVGGGLHSDTTEHGDKYDVHTGQVREPINYFRRIMKQLNWMDNSPTNITDQMGVTREIDDWQSLVDDGIRIARQQAWENSTRNRHNYKGMERGVNEATTRKHYLKLAPKEPMRAGAHKIYV
eukprot:13567066-Heterocapsa_arctica.AAC.1